MEAWSPARPWVASRAPWGILSSGGSSGRALGLQSSTGHSDPPAKRSVSRGSEPNNESQCDVAGPVAFSWFLLTASDVVGGGGQQL